MTEAHFVQDACTQGAPLFRIHTDGLPGELPIQYELVDDRPPDGRERSASDRTMGGPTRPRGNKRASSRSTDHHSAELVLYVSANSINSVRAIRSLTAFMQRVESSAVRMRIVDVAEDVTAAEKDRVLFTPTLIVTDSASRTTRLLGSLSNAEVLAELLRAVGIEPI